MDVNNSEDQEGQEVGENPVKTTDNTCEEHSAPLTEEQLFFIFAQLNHIRFGGDK